MRVLFIQAPEGGGNLIALYEMLREFDASRIDLVVLCYHKNQHTAALANIPFVKVYYVDNPALIKPLRIPRAKSKLLNILLLQLNILMHYFIAEKGLVDYIYSVILAERPDIVQHYTDIMSNRSAVRAARRAGITQVMYNHSLAKYGKKYTEYWLDRFLIRHISFHFHMSAAIAKHFNKLFHIPPNKNMVLHAMLDLKRFKPSPASEKLRHEFHIAANDFVIASIGRITDWKGQHVLIEAVNFIKDKLEDYKVLIAGSIENGIGSSSYQKYLEQLISTYGQEKDIVFTGDRDDIEAIINLSDVVVHSSVKAEPQGLVILESLLCDKKVIASNDGGAAELVKKYGGILSEPGDFQMLAGLLLEIRNKGNFEHYKDRVFIPDPQKLYNDFGSGKQMEIILSVYQKIIGDKNV